MTRYGFGSVYGGLIENCFAAFGAVSASYDFGGLIGNLAGGAVNRCYSTVAIGDGTAGGALIGLRDSVAIAVCFFGVLVFLLFFKSRLKGDKRQLSGLHN